MTERDKNQPSGWTRRQFLKSSLKLLPSAGLIVVGTSCFGQQRVGASNHEQRMYREIAQNRLSLGLDPYTDELADNKPDLDMTGAGIENLLPEDMKSYGMWGEEFMGKVFGPKGANLVRRVRIHPTNPHGYTFISQTVNLSLDIRNQSLAGFSDYWAHEAAGHGSCPRYSKNYPEDVRLRVVHGKYLAVARGFSIPGQLFNSPGDQTYPTVKKKVGENIGYQIATNQNLNNILDGNGAQMVKTHLREVAQNSSGLKFTKKVSVSLGDWAITHFREQNMGPKGELKRAYLTEMERGCDEIYAEEMRFMLLHPEILADDPQIRSGIEGNISAIRGETIDLESIRQSLKLPSQPVREQFARERRLKREQAAAVLPTQYSKEELEQMRRNQVEQELREAMYQSFITSGTISSDKHLDPVIKQAISEYGKSLGTVFKRYPVLLDPNHLDLEFDPELHVWDTERIENAVDLRFIRDFIIHYPVVYQLLPQLILYQQTLNQFIYSDAF